MDSITTRVLPTYESFLLLHLFSGVADKGGPDFGHEVPVEDGLLLESTQDQHTPPLEVGQVGGWDGECEWRCVCVCVCACVHVCVCVCIP